MSAAAPVSRWLRLAGIAAVIVPAGAVTPIAATADGGQTGTLVVTVLDASGASIPGAEVSAWGGADTRPVSTSAPAGSSRTSRAGVVALTVPAGTYRVVVSADGFQVRTLAQVEVRPGASTRRRVQLDVATVTERVEVGRDARSAALDPRGFSTFLSREQIDALPDAPDELARALQALAPPGAVLRIDGFTGGALPPKSQILSIRIPRLDSYAAQDHGGLSGFSAIEIFTRPGGNTLAGSAEGSGRDSSLNARDPLAARKSDDSLLAAALAVDGPILPDRLSFSFATRVSSEQQTGSVRAAVGPGVLRTDAVVRPRRAFTVTGRLAAALPGGQSLRVSASSETRRADNEGVGDANLPERAYQSVSSDTAVRATAGGPLGRLAFLESRVQVHRTAGRTLSAVEAPTERVVGAFTSGGAQLTGGAQASEILVASDLDFARGVHAWRGGVIVEAGRYQSNRGSNYLGTFTFASLGHYAAGRPATFTQRLGDAHVAYTTVQTGLYVQDDIRVARSLLLTAGVRYEQQKRAHGAVVLPRIGLAWSPSRDGRTTVRIGWGQFADWIPSSVYERTLAVDGSHQYDILIVNPDYPDATATSGLVPPSERYLVSPDLGLPQSDAASLGIEHRVAPGLRLYASYTRRAGRRLLRGDNLNPVVDGARARPDLGNVVMTRGDAASRTQTVIAQATTTGGARLSASAAYVFSDSRTNTAGEAALPAMPLQDEWGAVTPTHAATATLTVRVARTLTATLTPRWRSGSPYTITTGFDDNGDGLFTDRPPGLRRNSARTPAQCEVSGRLAYVWRLGRAAASARGAAAARTDAAVRRRIEAFANVQNLTNRPNYAVIGSVRTSPLFGRPIAAASARRFDVGVRFAF